MSGSRRTFTAEFKQEAVQLVAQQGLSVSEAAVRLGINPNLIRKWKQVQEQGPVVASSRQPSALEAENTRLRAENERLRMEREILKKATAFFVKESR
jgi:transposase